MTEEYQSILPMQGTHMKPLGDGHEFRAHQMVSISEKKAYKLLAASPEGEAVVVSLMRSILYAELEILRGRQCWGAAFLPV